MKAHTSKAVRPVPVWLCTPQIHPISPAARPPSSAPLRPGPSAQPLLPLALSPEPAMHPCAGCVSLSLHWTGWGSPAPHSYPGHQLLLEACLPSPASPTLPGAHPATHSLAPSPVLEVAARTALELVVTYLSLTLSPPRARATARLPASPRTCGETARVGQTPEGTAEDAGKCWSVCV